MLYMHGGLIRTGTTSLQAALIAHQEGLAAAGILYPDRWRLPGGTNHHGFMELFAEGEREQSREDFWAELEALPQPNVLISAESLTHMLAPPALDRLLAFLVESRRAMPAISIWTMRNLVDVLGSLYHRQTLVNHDEPPPPTEFLRFATAAPGWPETSFAGLLRVAETVETVVVQYRPDGSHQAEILKAIDAPPRLRASIVEHLEREPRLNGRLTQKKAAAILNVGEISARTGFAMSRPDLRALFFRDDFRFEDDRPCRLFDSAIERELHERALAAAARAGFQLYLDFFGETRIEDRPPTRTDLEVLSDDDLHRLVDGLREAQGDLEYAC